MYTISRSGTYQGNPKPTLAVHFSMSADSAINGTDYGQINSPVTILAGNDSVTVTLTPINDAVYEPNETAVLTITPDSSYLAAGGPATAIINSLATFLPLPGEDLSSARAMHNTRRSVGLSTIAPYNWNNYHAVYWDIPPHLSWQNISAVQIPVPAHVYSAYALAIGGQTIAGVGWQTAGHANVAFYRLDNTTTLLPPFPGRTACTAYGINAPGPGIDQWVVGIADIGNSRQSACYWNLGTPPVDGLIDLGMPEGESWSWALGINEGPEGFIPQIVGQSAGPSGYKPLVWRNGAGSLQVLPLLSGYQEGVARDVDNFGNIVGWVWNTETGIARGVRWTYDDETEIYTPNLLATPTTLPAGFSSYPQRINEFGRIVSYANDSVNGPRAVMWDVNGIHFLNDLLPSATLQFIAAFGVNDLGEAGEVEEGTLKKGFLLSP